MLNDLSQLLATIGKIVFQLGKIGDKKMIKSLLLVSSLLLTSVAVADDTEDRYGSKIVVQNKNVICFVANSDIYGELHNCLKSMGVYDGIIYNFNGKYFYTGDLEGEKLEGEISIRSHEWVSL